MIDLIIFIATEKVENRLDGVFHADHRNRLELDVDLVENL